MATSVSEQVKKPISLSEVSEALGLNETPIPLNGIPPILNFYSQRKQTPECALKMVFLKIS